MVRGLSIALGVGLTILWLVGLSNHATSWLTWLDGAAALAAFGIGASISPEGGTVANLTASPVALSIGLFALWIAGLVLHAQMWLVWWTFVFACGFLLTALLGISERRTGPTAGRTIRPTRTA